MRIKVGVVTQKIAFVGIDSADHITRKTGLSGFTVYYSLNGGTATIMTTPTVAELSAANMAGDYTLLVDEAGMVSAAGELTLHITATGMDPVTRIVEITTNLENDIYDRVGAPAGASIAADLVTIDNFVDDLETRLTATRAGYLDNLSAGAVATAAALATVDGIVDAILVDTDTTIPAILTTIDTVVDAILVDTAVIGALGAGLTAIPWNAAWDAEVQSECADALTAYDPPTRAEATADKAEIIVYVDKIDDATDGLTAIKAEVEGLAGAAMRGTDSAALASVCTEARLAELDAANLITDVANVKSDTAAILIDTSVIGALGAGLTAIPWNAAWDTEVQSECTDALNAYDPPTRAELTTDTNSIITQVNANETKIDIAQADLDILTGVDGVTLATLQANYAPNIVVPDVAGTAATLHGITDAKIDTVDGIIDSILVDTADMQPKLGTPAADLSADIAAVKVDSAAIKVKTDSLPSGIAKNVALSNFQFFMVLSSDHVTASTGETVTGTISKDGGAFAALTNAISEIGNGMYKVNLTQTEMNADVITLKFTAANSDQRVITVYTT